MLRKLFRPKETVDMTEGKILPHLIRFAVPLLIGNLFQQFYNMVDTWVVGNYASNEAFSAVGSVGVICNIVLGFFVGFSGGTGVVISQYYGAGEEKGVQKTVHTAMTVTLISGVVLALVGNALIPVMLSLMKIPDSVYPEAATYLSVYFTGIMGIVVYNIGAGILRAVGDSQRPLYFLIVSSLVNVVLDLLLVKSMGVRGVALATVIAQSVSAVLVVITLYRTRSVVRLQFKNLRIHTDVLKKIIRVGLPSGVQMMITAVSNVFVQSYVNVYGPDYMSGWTTYSKIDALLFLPMQSFALASSTFVGQNLGKGQEERAKKGSNTALFSSLAVTAVLIVPILLFREPMVAFFNDRAEVVAAGAMLLLQNTPFYLLCCVNQVYSASLRGAGNSRAPMLIMLSSFVAFRQCYLFAISRIFPGNFTAVALSYPAGWLLCCVSMLIYYWRTPLKSRLLSPQS